MAGWEYLDQTEDPVVAEHRRRTAAGIPMPVDPATRRAEVRRQETIRNGPRPSNSSPAPNSPTLGRSPTERNTRRELINEGEAARVARRSAAPLHARRTFARAMTMTGNRQISEAYYPHMFRMGQLRPMEEIQDEINRQADSIEGMEPEAALRQLFGGRETRPTNRPQSRAQRRSGMEFAEPLVQGLPEVEPTSPQQITDAYGDIRQEAVSAAREISLRRKRLLGDSEGVSRFGYGLAQNLMASAQDATSFGLRGAADAARIDIGSVHISPLEFADSLGTVMAEDAASRRQAGTPEYERGSLPYYTFGISRSLLDLGAAVGVGMTTRNPATTSSFIMGSIVGGQETQRAIEAGYSRRAALGIGAVYGLTELAPERIAIGAFLSAALRPGKSAVRRVGTAVGVGALSEAGQEAVTEFLQIGLDEGVFDEQTDLGEALNRIKDAMIMGAGAGAGVAGGVAGLSGIAAARQRRFVERIQNKLRVQFRGPDDGAQGPAVDEPTPGPVDDPDARNTSDESFADTQRLMEKYDSQALPGESRADFVIRKTREEERFLDLRSRYLERGEDLNEEEWEELQRLRNEYDPSVIDGAITPPRNPGDTGHPSTAGGFQPLGPRTGRGQFNLTDPPTNEPMPPVGENDASIPELPRRDGGQGTDEPRWPTPYRPHGIDFSNEPMPPVGENDAAPPRGPQSRDFEEGLYDDQNVHVANEAEINTLPDKPHRINDNLEVGGVKSFPIVHAAEVEPERWGRGTGNALTRPFTFTSDEIDLDGHLRWNYRTNRWEPFSVSRVNGEELPMTRRMNRPFLDAIEEQIKDMNPNFHPREGVINRPRNEDPNLDDLFPSYHQGSYEFTSEPGADVGRLSKMFGRQLYGDPSLISSVTIKELLQNSFDSVRSAMLRDFNLKGKIDINVDRNSRTINMTDNGVGMTPEVLGKQFLQIAGTGKEQAVGGRNSGGFGVAKMLFLYENGALIVTSARDGKVATLVTSGDELKLALSDPSYAPKVSVRPFDPLRDGEMFPDGHGVHIEAEIPKTFKDDDGHEIDVPLSDNEYSYSVLTHSPLFEDIDVRFNGNLIDDIGSKFDKEKYKPFATIDAPWGKTDIIVSREEERYVGYYNVHILSNGIHQYSLRLEKNPLNSSDAIPYTFFFDIHPKGRPEDAGYPFGFNRQGLTDEAQKSFKEVISYIHRQYAGKSAQDLAQSFGTMRYLDDDGNLTEIRDLRPEVPVVSTDFKGIDEGSHVIIKDGRLLLNGEELPPLSMEDMKKTFVDRRTLMIDPSLIDHDRTMIHDNSVIKGLSDNFDAFVWEQGDRSVTEHMSQMFGQHFSDYLNFVGNTFHRLRAFVVEYPEYKNMRTAAIGLSFDKKYMGVSIMVPFVGKFLNPLKPDPPLAGKEIALDFLGTMIHEFTHYRVRSHGADYVNELQRLQNRLEANETYTLFKDAFVRDLKRYEDVIEEGKRLYEGGHVETAANSFEERGENTISERGDEGDSDLVSFSRPSGGDGGPDLPRKPRRGVKDDGGGYPGGGRAAPDTALPEEGGGGGQLPPTDRPATVGPEEEPEPEFGGTRPHLAGNINLNQINNTADLDHIYQKMAEHLPTNADRYQGQEATAELATQYLGMTPEDLVKHNPKLVEAPQYALALRELTKEASQYFIDSARRVNVGDLSNSAIENFYLSQLRFAMLLDRTMETAGVAGRLLNIHNKMAEGGPDYLKMVREVPNELWKDPANAQKLAMMVAEATDPVRIAKIARGSLKPGIEDYFFSAWYNWGLLSNPATHMANVTGTAMHLFADLTSKSTASLLGSGFGLSRTGSRILGREVVARIYGIYRAMRTVLPFMTDPAGYSTRANMSKAFKEGSPLDQISRIERPTVFHGWPGYLLEFPTRMLALEDEFFRSVAHLSELYGQAVKIAHKEGSKGKDLMDRVEYLANHPTEDMTKAAVEYGKHIRFQDEPSPLGKAIEMVRTRSPRYGPVGRAGAAIVRLFMPFVRTIDRLFGATARYAPPLALVEKKNRQGLYKGGDEGDEAVGRLIVGTGLVTMALMWSVAGTLNGAGPSHPSRREQQTATGAMPFTAMDRNGNWVNLKGYEPFSTVLIATATLRERLSAGEITQEEYAEQILKVALETARVANENNWTLSLTNLTDTMNPARGDSSATNMVANLASSMVTPSVLRMYNQEYVDNVVRDTRGSGTLSGRIAGRIQSTWPFNWPGNSSRSMDPNYDVYGREVRRGDSIGPNWLFRLDVTPRDPDPVSHEVLRLSRDNSNELLVGPPGTRITVDGVSRRLTPHEQQEYQRVSGQMIHQQLTELMFSEGYQGMDDADKRIAVRDIVERARSDARDDLFNNTGWEDEGSGGGQTGAAPAPAGTQTSLTSTQGVWEYMGEPGGPIPDARLVIERLFPNAEVTEHERDPDSDLGRANPDSWHNLSGAAIDVRPIRGMSYRQFLTRITRAGYIILDERNEVTNPSPHATGPHWHVVLGEPR